MPEGEPPGRLLLERRLVRGDDEHVRRITDDGRVWTRSTVRARLADGEWTFAPGDGAWEEGPALPPEALAALREAIRASGLLDTAAEHLPDRAVIGGSDEIWTADLDGRRTRTALRGVPETHVPAAATVAAALEDALAAADGG